MTRHEEHDETVLILEREGRRSGRSLAEVEAFEHAAECVRFVAALDSGEVANVDGKAFGNTPRVCIPTSYGARAEHGTDVLAAWRAVQTPLVAARLSQGGRDG